MLTEIILWATVLLFTIHLGGHIFDKIAIIPNWSSGEIDDMQCNKAFFRKGQIRTFFGWMHLTCFLFSLAAVILLWGHESQAALYSKLAFGLNFASSIWSIVYFVPMNKYFEGQDYEAEKLKHLVKNWTSANQLRFVLLTVALGLSIAAFEYYRS